MTNLWNVKDLLVIFEPGISDKKDNELKEMTNLSINTKYCADDGGKGQY